MEAVDLAVVCSIRSPSLRSLDGSQVPVVRVGAGEALAIIGPRAASAALLDVLEGRLVDLGTAAEILGCDPRAPALRGHVQSMRPLRNAPDAVPAHGTAVPPTDFLAAASLFLCECPEQATPRVVQGLRCAIRRARQAGVGVIACAGTAVHARILAGDVQPFTINAERRGDRGSYAVGLAA